MHRLCRVALLTLLLPACSGVPQTGLAARPRQAHTWLLVGEQPMTISPDRGHIRLARVQVRSEATYEGRAV